METLSELTVRHDGGHLSYGDVCAMAERIAAARAQGLVCIRLTQTTDTTLGALARLILLRAILLKAGRDLYIVGLTGRAENLYIMYGMHKLLPRMPMLAGEATEADHQPAFRGDAVFTPSVPGGPYEAQRIEEAGRVPVHA